MLLTDKPLWMPQGSVRSILALGITGAFVAGLIDAELVAAVVGFYFGARTTEEPVA